MEQPQSSQELVEAVRRRFDHADQGVHRRFRDKADHLTALYRSYREQRPGIDPRDKDPGLPGYQREWGAELFIPFAFSTVETILPRMLSNTPKILVNPRGKASEANVENIRQVIEAQQEQIDYELVLQAVARMALIVGLGVQKVYWRRQERTQKLVRPRTVALPGMSRYVVEERRGLVFDDPFAESIDPRDFIWDPMGTCIANCEWVVHRTWRSTEYCLDRLRAGVWSGITEDDVTMGGEGASRYSEVFASRNRIAGYPNTQPRGVHEVWEFHDTRRVLTILNRQLLVQEGENPNWHGELPFQVFRPTPVEGQMAGIGEIEPIEDLQLEINTLRSQRRDNATLVLQKAFFYTNGLVDTGQFKVGPGLGIPVDGDPREAIMPLEWGEIPNSSYQEERQLQADIERTSGIDDSLSGAGSPQQTATGIQLVQAAANLRIQQKTRNCEVEIVRAGGRQFLSLSQQRIVTNREYRVPAQPTPMEPDRRWAWLSVGPAELAGEFIVDVEGGSMAPENTPQRRQDAQAMIALLSNAQVGPYLNPEQVIRFVLENMGVRGVDAWLQAPQDKTPTALVEQFKKTLGQMVSPAMVEQAWNATMGAAKAAG